LPFFQEELAGAFALLTRIALSTARGDLIGDEMRGNAFQREKRQLWVTALEGVWSQGGGKLVGERENQADGKPKSL